MPRYIDADALMKEFRDFVRDSNNSDFAPVPNWNDAVSLVGSAPTADVVERKHGKWMKHNDRACWYCSECKEDNYYAYSWNNDTGKYEFQDHFCPNCGADMVKGEEDES